ncbi:hypothetical protein [Sphingomonas colocasiae]|uniref:DUF3617 family protein n=1 Tax=Sphingomonas colocasiae TaxID=1848973 RepID=A0ABS7PVB2_9SPHN|nr:hypothetical protein [Sphingomonas colocasiae]MBY8825296.1 hypothetical protein [Sphingomonas colocasiae]
MKTRCILLIAAAGAVASTAIRAQPAPAGAAGRWVQSSSGKELVLAPRIKLQPNVGVSHGTNLGGTVGYGSMTRTTIVTEAVPMDVARSMTLAIQANGRFEWTIVRRHAEKPDCTLTTTQVKRGQVAQGNGKAVFTVEGGTESFASSCGRKGTSALAKATERYDMQLAGGRFVLSSGPSRWAFTRG